jgi:hypothetical protein
MDKRKDVIRYKVSEKEIPVMTTKQLAESYGVVDEVIRKNFSRNAKRFIEGKHYYKIPCNYDEYLNVSISHSKDLPKSSAGFVVWSEKGAARHAKIINNDIAWDIFEELEDTYFNLKEKPLCMEDMIIESAKNLKAIRLEQEKQNAKIKAQENRIDVLEAKSINSPYEFYSVVAYCNLNDIKCELKAAAAWGRAATKLSKELGVRMGNTPDPRFGQVNTYHEDILREVIEGYER